MRRDPIKLQAVQPLVLCGGSGARLWPLSRGQQPKQLINLVSAETMLETTVKRIAASHDLGGARIFPPLVVASENYRHLVAEQLRRCGRDVGALLLEPVGRNTAPALTLGALAATAYGEDPVLVVMPADHVIGDESAFRATVTEGVRHAADGLMVTFGIPPAGAETGYGYIRVGPCVEAGVEGACLIAGFAEKPDAETARLYASSGEYLWNSGIFMVRALAWLDLIREHRPEIWSACTTAFAGRERDGVFTRVERQAFTGCPADSIDYAVLEHLAPGRGIVLPLGGGWSDVGSWDALWKALPKDGSGNVLNGDILAVDTRDTLALSHSRLIACVGVDNLAIVETADALLVANKDRVQDVRKIVDQLQQGQRREASTHRRTPCPWGWYESLEHGTRFQVKRLVVNPGAKLSLQMHHHRAEHWVVVSGTARVTNGEWTQLVSENESVYIPIGQQHRVENPGRVPLEIIEVQVGTYLGEDDIVRFDDSYGRGVSPRPAAQPVAAGQPATRAAESA